MCPGQNTQFWKPGDIFDIVCPACGAKVEFFKDDARRRCMGCGHIFPNPKLNEGCAKWCKFADKCLGLNAEIHDGKPLKGGFSPDFKSGVKFGVE
jgi:DNA-directed RNA polymerase subunit RPC12/RpoP